MPIYNAACDLPRTFLQPGCFCLALYLCELEHTDSTLRHLHNNCIIRKHQSMNMYVCNLIITYHDWHEMAMAYGIAS